MPRKEQRDGGGETRIWRDIETIRSLPGDTESTSHFFGFALVLQLATANRLSRFDLRFSVPPLPSVCLLLRSGDRSCLSLGLCESGVCLSQTSSETVRWLRHSPHCVRIQPESFALPGLPQSSQVTEDNHSAGRTYCESRCQSSRSATCRISPSPAEPQIRSAANEGTL